MSKLLSIVVNNNFIRIAELSAGKKGVLVSRLLTKELPSSMLEDGMIRNVREFSEFLSATLRMANIKTKRVVFSLPSDKVMTREIMLPELGEEKLKTTVMANASEYFPIDLGDYVLSYFIISKVLEDTPEDETESAEEKGKKGKKKSSGKNKKKNKKTAQLRIMVLAAPSDMVQAYYDVARLARLNVEAIDYLGNSVLQLTENQVGEEACLVVQLNQTGTVLTIFYENVMVLQRHVDFGSSSVIQAVAEQNRGTLEEAEQLLRQAELIHDNFEDGDPVTDSLYYLISNIKRVIEYYAGRNADRPLEQVYVMGEGSVMPGLNALLDNQLNLPVESITALKQVYIDEKAGLSMDEVLSYMDNIGAAIAPVDFVPKKLEQDMRRKMERKAYRIMILLSLLASVVIVAVPTVKFFSVAMDTMDLQNRLLTLEEVKPILDNYNQAAGRYIDVQQVGKLARTNNQSLKGFVDVFEQLRPSNVSITDFSCSNGEITFNALASGKKTVIKLIQQLQMVTNVSDVKVSNLSSTFEGNVETVSFSVTCKLVNEDFTFGYSSSEESQDTPAMSVEEAVDYINSEVYGVANTNGSEATTE